MGEDVGTIHAMTGNVVALDEPMMLVLEKKTKIIHAVMYAYRGRIDNKGPWEVRPHMTGCYGLYRGEHMLSALGLYTLTTYHTHPTCVFCIGWRGEKFWPKGVNCRPQSDYPKWPK